MNMLFPSYTFSLAHEPLSWGFQFTVLSMWRYCGKHTNLAPTVGPLGHAGSAIPRRGFKTRG